MKISSQLFFRAIIVEYLEDLGFTLRSQIVPKFSFVPQLFITCDFENIRVKVGIKTVYVYDMSQKSDLDKLKVYVKYNETRSLDKVRDAVNELLNKELCLARVE